jgi:hypothetical protein
MERQMEFGIVRECRSCGRELAAYQTGCLHCDGEAGFQFPWLHAIGIGVFAVGALLYHSNPELGAMVMQIVGYEVVSQ